MSDTFVLVIKVLASLSALYMCLSPSTSIYRIHKKRSTGPSSVVPLVALWGCNHMWLLYGYVTDNIFPLMVTYVVGDVTSMLFIAVFCVYAPNRRFVLKTTGATLLINAAATIYVVLAKRNVIQQSTDQRNLVVGCIAIASSILLYASPFATIKHVVRTKSSASIMFSMVMVGIVNNALWIIYGFLIHDAFLVIPTLINVVIGFVQLALYIVYHPKRQKPASTSALYMCFTPIHAIARIHREKSVGHMPSLPLVAQWLYNHIWMLYGFLTRAYFPLFATYAVGSALSMGFIAVYYYWADTCRYRVLRLAALALLFIAGSTA
ncbi:hypothetical protein ATCC90586_008294 [Pythium insidiosum]|nr:hypothetical protein ATCC90586_008294 [Pythium insidiosum]